jgi:hypothetical protein
MADHSDIALRLASDSDIVRIKPNCLVQIFESGTTTLVDEVLTDATGRYSFAALPVGKYDIRIDGQTVSTFHHVTSIPDERWQLFRYAAITSDNDALNAVESHFSEVAGTILKVKLIAHKVDATGDLTVHILKGPSGGVNNLTVASDSVWNHRIHPASAQYRYTHVDAAPDITINENDVVALGYDWTANIVEGVLVTMFFRPDP